MRRTLLLLVTAIALFAVACGSPATQLDSTAPSSTSSPSTSDAPSGDTGADEAPSTTSGSTDDGSTTSMADDRPKPEGPAAPDFALALGSDRSEEFVLSQEVKPVFMVFWAEW